MNADQLLTFDPIHPHIAALISWKKFPEGTYKFCSLCSIFEASEVLEVSELSIGDSDFEYFKLMICSNVDSTII